MSPLRGWSKRGQRLRAKVPYGHWTTMTFLAALRNDRVEAPWLLKGPINGECFRLYVDKVLVPTLRPGDIVVLDNLGSHKNKAVRQAIRAAGARLFFPAQILARPQSNRAALRQAEARAPQSRQANLQHRLGRDRRGPRHRLTKGMLKLPGQRRICTKLIASCSRCQSTRRRS